MKQIKFAEKYYGEDNLIFGVIFDGPRSSIIL